MRRTLLLLAVTLAGCGGGGDEGSDEPATTPPTGAVTITTPEDTARAAPTPTGNPTFTVQLAGESSTAAVGKPWRYTVRVRAKSGAAAGGIAKMRVFDGDELVDTIGFFQLDGVLTKTHKFPVALKGKTVTLQAEVEGDGGTVRVNFPVTVD